jgi:hypothetical protein
MVTMRLYDCASTVRSKNAGPFTLSIDLMFDDRTVYNLVMGSGCLTPERVAAEYGVPAGSVQICPFERIRTIKVSMPRPGSSSGAPGDCDVYGCQQHFPLADLEIPGL